MLLNIKNLHVSIGGKEILKGFNLGVNEARALGQPPLQVAKAMRSPKAKSGTKARTS